MVILAIDPGFDKLGFAIFDKDEKKRDFKYIASGLIKTNTKEALELRLKAIHDSLVKIIAEHHPHLIVMEQLFFTRNISTAIAVAQAQGTVLLLAALNNMHVLFLTPSQIKQIVTGYGNADKRAVHKMVELSLKQKVSVKEDDETDAIACGLAYCYLRENLL